jgi:hypothetical protein
MNHYLEIKVAITELVAVMKKLQKPVDPDTAAIKLSSKFPQSGLTIDEIAREIEKAAKEVRVPLVQRTKPLPGVTHFAASRHKNFRSDAHI